MGLGLGLRSTLHRLRAAVPVPNALAQLINYMARTGHGTDECLRAGSLPLPVHFYSPVPDVADLDRRDVWNRRSELPGVDFRAEEQVGLLKELGARYGLECDWPTVELEDEHAFHLQNPAFGYGCAAATRSMLRHAKPRRVIEVGSGYSSRVISAALRENEAEGAPRAHYAIIDPFPAPATRTLPGLTRITLERVEVCSPSAFDELAAGDVLFVDSGHTVRIGGDVNFLVLEVLPRLAPGVLVHFHDVHLPYEYDRFYYVTPSFRMLWTEAYLLQSFLAFNSQYEVVLGMTYLMRDRAEEFRAAFPRYDPTRHRSISGSFWIRRKDQA